MRETDITEEKKPVDGVAQQGEIIPSESQSEEHFAVAEQTFREREHNDEVLQLASSMMQVTNDLNRHIPELTQQYQKLMEKTEENQWDYGSLVSREHHDMALRLIVNYQSRLDSTKYLIDALRRYIRNFEEQRKKELRTKYGVEEQE